MQMRTQRWVTFDLDPYRPLAIVSVQNKMAAAIERSRDMQMRCDVIGHVTVTEIVTSVSATPSTTTTSHLISW